MRTKYKPEFNDIAKTLLSEGKSITQVCGHFEIDRKTFYNWLDDPNKLDFQEAVAIGLVKSEAVYESKLQSFIHGASCSKGELTSLIYLMKCRFKERWLETPVQVNPDAEKKPLANMSDKEIDQQLNALLSLKLEKAKSKDTVVQ